MTDMEGDRDRKTLHAQRRTYTEKIPTLPKAVYRVLAVAPELGPDSGPTLKRV